MDREVAETDLVGPCGSPEGPWFLLWDEKQLKDFEHWGDMVNLDVTRVTLAVFRRQIVGGQGRIKQSREEASSYSRQEILVAWSRVVAWEMRRTSWT